MNQGELFKREGSRVHELVGKKRSKIADYRRKVRAVLEAFKPRLENEEKGERLSCADISCADKGLPGSC